MKGFTLVEVIIAAGVGLVVGVLLVSILVNHNGLSFRENAVVSEGLSLNDAMSKINQSIKEAAQVSDSYQLGEALYTSDADTLVLKLSAVSSLGVVDDAFDYVVVFQDPQNAKILRFKVSPDPQSSRSPADLVLNSSLVSARFSYLDKNGNSVSPSLTFSVSVDLTVLTRTGSASTNRTSSSNTTLRNFSQ